MPRHASDLDRRARVHAALGEPARLAIVDDLITSDRSPRDLGRRLGLGSNLLAHHLDILEGVGIVTRIDSSGDGRRRYVRLESELPIDLGTRSFAPRGPMLFVCTRNSARSRLAAALWTSRTGRSASSAGTDPADRIHRGALSAAKRAGVHMMDEAPIALGAIPRNTQVVTVCDLVHEDLEASDDWWHWSIPDPVVSGSARAFDAVVDDIDRRIRRLHLSPDNQSGAST